MTRVALSMGKPAKKRYPTAARRCGSYYCGPQPSSDLGQSAGQDFEPEVFLVSQAVGSTLDHADLVVEALDIPKETLFSGWQ